LRYEASAVNRSELHALLSRRPAILAPMEDVSDVVFRRICRELGADLTVTEFVNVEGLLRGCRNARRKIRLAPDDRPTAIQIYGSDPARLAEAARVAEEAGPAFIDVNCGCWVPKVAGRGAGAGWLRDPDAMVAMAGLVVRSVSLPVTVKTRIGWGPESHMPIVDLARRLEDVGVAAITLHCRTAQMGHGGAADWSWAQKARSVVSIPVVVNGDVRSGEDAERALRETGCEGVMVGRRAIEHPWVFREIRARLDRGEDLAGPTVDERIDLCIRHLRDNVGQRTAPHGVHCTRRHMAGYLKGLPGASALRQALFQTDSLEGCVELLEAARVRARAIRADGPPDGRAGDDGRSEASALGPAAATP
jgi:nifR3 family TIM-barrel protein